MLLNKITFDKYINFIDKNKKSKEQNQSVTGFPKFTSIYRITDIKSTTRDKLLLTY
jgi:hypothetical protein